MLHELKKLLKQAFERKHPYAPVAYLGRKTVEQSMQCKVTKKKKLFRELASANDDQKNMSQKAS